MPMFGSRPSRESINNYPSDEDIPVGRPVGGQPS